ncbi:ABC transporter substrate-binding protein [Novosphingobium rosa]|uniref:ABC transporter substrate-binding protein n=1 Tax=Novosphingobium rosa TaxID=76978 RepID=UPI00082E2CE7|nr:ABC transporter substrate-binding protein [Novosphingobium rosa]
MAFSRRPAVSGALALLALAAGGMSGCHRKSESATRIAVIGEPGAPWLPAQRNSLAGHLLSASLGEGLVSFDAEGKVVPGLAERWIVADDGQSYIFRLRGAAWADGQMSAESVRQGLRNAIAALKGTPEAPDFAAVEDIRAMTGRVIEIRLSRPMPQFLPLLALPEMALPPRQRLAGPMVLKQDGISAVLSPVPPEKRALPPLEDWARVAHPLRMSVMPAAQAIAAFNAGRLEMVLGGSFADLPSGGRTLLGKTTLRLDPVVGLFGLAVENEEGLLSSAALREALSMAIDRPAMTAQIGVPNWQNTTRLIAPGSAADTGLVIERWADMDLPARRTLAAQRVAQWVKVSGGPARLRVALPVGPGADALAARLRADFATIGVEVQRVDHKAPADLRLIDEVNGEPTPGWFLQRFGCALRPQACSPAADALTAQALDAPDANAARGLFAQAEGAMLGENLFLPLGAPVRWSLVAGDSLGFALNRWGLHSLPPMAIRSR